MATVVEVNDDVRGEFVFEGFFVIFMNVKDCVKKIDRKIEEGGHVSLIYDVKGHVSLI